MPTILEQLKSGVPIKFNIQKLMPGTLAETTSGFFGLLPTTATWRIKAYWLKTGEKIGDGEYSFSLKTQAEEKGNNPLASNMPYVGHELIYDPDKHDVSVGLYWIEVSGALIHPISIEAVTVKEKMDEFFYPSSSVVVKGMLRSASSTQSDTIIKDPSGIEWRKHTLNTILLYKYIVYGGNDENGYGYANPPQPSEADTLKDKLFKPGITHGYASGFVIMKYRL